jgi:hypothetical protein
VEVDDFPKTVLATDIPDNDAAEVLLVTTKLVLLLSLVLACRLGRSHW